MSKFDASIPVLTEVFRDEPAAAHIDPEPAGTDAFRDAPLAPAPAAAYGTVASPGASARSEAPTRSAQPFSGAALTLPGGWPYRAGAARRDAPAADAGRDALAAEGAPTAPSAPAADALDWDLMERQVSQRVLQQLTARVDFVLEQRIKDNMEEVLTSALRGLTNEIRAGLHDTMGKIVARAVQQEITHLQASTPPHDDKR